MRIEVYLGNWGTVICHNEAHKTYLRAAKTFRDIQSSVCSWQTCWLSASQKEDYLRHESEAKAFCEKLWDLIPNKTDDLSKSH